MSSESKKHGKLIVSVITILGITVLIMNLTQSLIISKMTESSIDKIYDENVSEVANMFSSNVKTQLENYLKQLRYYTKSDIVDTADPEQIIDWLHEHESDRPNCYDYVIFVEPDGTWHSDDGNSGNVSERAYFKEIFGNNKDFVIDSPVVSKNHGRPVLHVVEAVKKDGVKFGFFAGVVPLDEIINITDSIHIGETGYSALIDKKGFLVSTQDPTLFLKRNFTTDSDLSTETKDFFAKAINLRNGDSISKTIISPKTGEIEFTTCFDIKDTPIVCIVGVQETQIKHTSKKILSWLMCISFIVLVCTLVIIALVIGISLKPLGIITSSIQNMASGNADLTQRINLNSNNEIGAVVQGFNAFIEKMQNIVFQIKDSKVSLSSAGTNLNESSIEAQESISSIIGNISEIQEKIDIQSNSVNQTAGAVNEIASNINSLEQMIDSQSAQVANASAAVEEMIGNISSVNQSVEKMANSFDLLRQSAMEGSAKQADVNARIEEIEKQSAMLQEANQAIAAIAEQTNLLAMNAAIEAAHAGEAGKGFSVVADEIRKLSETSSSQSRTIGDQLSNIKDSINSVVTASGDSSKAFKSVTEKIQETDELVVLIKGAMEEQQAGSKQIGDALHSMNDSTLEVKNASAEMSEGNKAILDEIQNLQDATFAIKSSMNEMSSGADRIKYVGDSLTNVSSALNESISEIGDQIDTFSV